MNKGFVRFCLFLYLFTFEGGGSKHKTYEKSERGRQKVTQMEGGSKQERERERKRKKVVDGEMAGAGDALVKQ